MASLIYSLAERVQESELAARASRKITRLRRSRSRFRSFDKVIKGQSQKSNESCKIIIDQNKT